GIWFYYGVQRHEEALREFDALAELWPGNVDVMRFQSVLYRRVGRWEDAIRTMERILELDPADVGWRVTILTTYLSMRRFEEAERYGQTAVSLDPTVPSHWWWLSSAHMSRGDTAAARRTLDSARQHLDDETIESGWAWVLLHFYTDGTEEVLDFYLDQQPFPTYGAPDLGLAVAAANGRDDLVRLFADTLQGWARNALESLPAEYAVARSRELSYSALAQAYLGNE
ncbi:MAG: tetratricopeptide repeat protein, partial [Gemmatimonadetes bacterium]|nr:tetratricopeptide repeat protein [Gemmatimonadota bacterium]NIR79062.1 tetratricopeptide repeat protein [Gemmatimonadota bacterium]NIT87720.1 tetratricopeptide repeat protein [Gemmatimonadota bacterium]NIU31580.1 tetratricopeptide repeat protein [Gemmatimonadota bacterium]NIV61928.1 tetratricopeptide repeat protein [Gemmatimonadota bacterium]